MPDIVAPEHRELYSKFIETFALYKKFEDMINLGAYKEGSNPKVDYAIKKIDKLKSYIKQGINEKRDLADSIQGLFLIFGQKEAEI